MTWCPQARLLRLSSSRRWQSPWSSDPTDTLGNGAGSTTKLAFDVQTTTHGRAWDLCRPGTTVECPGMSRYPSSNGKRGVGMPSTGTTPRTGVMVEIMSGAVCVTGRAIMTGHLADAVPVENGPVLSIWCRRLVWM
eukprot:591650-Amphidinium_carterae.1